MFIGILNIVAAIVLSIVSAFFSVTGIQTIFSGAVVGATLMGVSLEFSKITATVWLYSWWKKAAKFIKYYLVFAIVVLILISSIGIYGYLSKAYVGQEVSTSNISTQIDRIETSIERQQNDIERAKQGLKALDDAIQIYFDYDQATKGLEQREEQTNERERYNQIINDAQDKINELQDQKFVLLQEENEQSVNVGPIKYIATLIYGEENAESNYDDAARIFILLLVIVFDPFAVLLMVSGNLAIDKSRKKKRKTQKKAQNKTAPKKKKPEPQKKSTELPMAEKKKDNQVVVDMSNYINPEEIKNLKGQTEHRPLRKKNKKSEEG